MTNSTNQVASATLGSPEIMADIIDSLKRLERIGSENSKTVEKIIEAAREMEAKIVSQFRRQRNEIFISASRLAMNIAREERNSLNEAAASFGVASDHLHDLDYKIINQSDLIIGKTNEQVWANRSAALLFSKDLANGLLNVIAEYISQEAKENEAALEALETHLLAGSDDVWYKVSMTSHDIVARRNQKLQEDFTALFVISNAPLDAGMFRASNSVDFNYYFSPGAARIAMPLIKDHGGKRCKPPQKSNLAIIVCNGGGEAIPFASEDFVY
ncbi:MAG TPA: hypothetical protein VGN17_25515 [Bryobacteraceae bacterium]|jgi:hypothetical protein